jgi:hypothetical protein
MKQSPLLRKLLPLLLILALLLVALPAQVVRADTPPSIEDQSFTTPTNASLTLESVGFMRIAQTFTAGITGALHAVSIDLKPTGPDDVLYIVLMGVTNGVPDGTFLADRFLYEADMQALSNDALSYQIPMPDVYIQAGKQYAIMVGYLGYPPSAPPTSTWSGATGNLYSGGSAFTAANGSYFDWQPVIDPGLDLHFRTFVITGPISDLTVTRTMGANKATACRQFSEIYKVTNNGPDTAEKVGLYIGLTDHFDIVSLTSWPGGKTGTFTLAPGQSMQFKAVIKVTAFVPGESREARVSATAINDSSGFTIDPNPDNNWIENIVWMQGQPRISCK